MGRDISIFGMYLHVDRGGSLAGRQVVGESVRENSEKLLSVSVGTLAAIIVGVLLFFSLAANIYFMRKSGGGAGRRR